MILVTNFAVACSGGSLLGFPTWYKYLDCIQDTNGDLIPRISGLADIWLIVAAVIDILLRAAALVAIAMIVYGGVLFITGSGESEKNAKARNTIINAAIGLVLSISAAALVTFVAGRFN